MFLPSGQNHQKQSEGSCVFVNSALKMRCHIVKNTLSQTVLPAILSTGLGTRKYADFIIEQQRKENVH